MAKKLKHTTPQIRIISIETAQMLASSGDPTTKTVNVGGVTNIQLSKGRSWNTDKSFDF